MADFDPALQKTLATEKGWANVPGDHGGETYQGIARNFHPDWPGWSIIDAVKRSLHLSPNLVHSDTLDHNLASQSALPGMVADFYRTNYWNPLNLDSQVQAVAEKVFDIAVNMGVSTAQRMLTEAEADA